MPEILDHGLFEDKQQPIGELVFFRDFFNEEQEAAFVAQLRTAGIPFKVEKSKTLLEGTITGYGLVPHSVVKLRAADFGAVNQLLSKEALGDANFITNHYFQGYKASELLEVVQQPDDWTPEDVAVARYLLDKQGIAIPEAQLANFKQQHLEALREGKTANLGWVLAYFAFILFGAVFLSPLFMVGGIGMGWYYWRDKTHDSNGNSYFTYSPTSRNLGKMLFFAGWFLQALAILLYFLKPYQAHFF